VPESYFDVATAPADARINSPIATVRAAFVVRLDRTRAAAVRENGARMENDAEVVTAHVDATAASVGIALGVERRAAVIAWVTRLRAFAADVAAVNLPDGEPADTAT
jgi:hypothetical protein